MQATQETYESLVEEMRREFPSWEIVSKDRSPLMSLIAKILFFNKTFMTTYVTSFGNWMWVPPDWDTWNPLVRCEVIRHERVHFRQQAKMGFIKFALTYLFLPLPILYAKGRADLEKEGYAESIRARAEYFGVQEVQSPDYRSYVIDQFTGPSYLWMWPFVDDLNKWYDSVLARIENDV